MASYSFIGSDGTTDPAYEELVLEDPAAVSQMASKFGREVLGALPDYAPSSEFFDVKVIENGSLLFTVLTFRARAQSKHPHPPASASPASYDPRTSQGPRAEAPTD